MSESKIITIAIIAGLAIIIIGLRILARWFPGIGKILDKLAALKSILDMFNIR